MYFGLKTYLFKVLHIFIILFYKVGKSQGKEIHLKPVFLEVNLMKMFRQVATNITQFRGNISLICVNRTFKLLVEKKCKKNLTIIQSRLRAT